jgi:hypothetical protein
MYELQCLGPDALPLPRLDTTQYACLNNLPSPVGAVVERSTGLSSPGKIPVCASHLKYHWGTPDSPKYDGES